MKLAFVDSLPVGGGLSRFSLLLCKGLSENFPEMSIDYFIHFENLKHIPEVRNLSEKVKVCILKSTIPLNSSRRLFEKALSKVLATKTEIDKSISEIENVVDSKYDLAYFPSAHMMRRPSLKIPIVGTLHDFNWKYFFGRQIFSIKFVELMDAEILNWMNNGTNICSSQDVVDEAKKLYPSAKNFPKIVYIAPVVVHALISDLRAEEILRSLKIDFPYIIFPGNFFPHKNHLNLFTAFSLLKKRNGFESLKLILTGMNSDQVKKGIAEYRGVRLITKNSSSELFDVIGLGYQSNEVTDALISKAKLLVSPSIYEAICTPAMDAWNFGIPTAISDIPPFREHEKAWDIRSAFFDPMNPKNIADVIEKYLNNYDKAIQDGITSKENMGKYTWKNVADGYMQVFQKAINK